MKKEMKHQPDLWLKLMSEEPELVYRMLIVRMMVDQRGVSVRKDLAPLTEVSGQTLYDAITVSKVRGNDEPWRSNTFTVDQIHAKLDILEDALTRHTDNHGGVYALTESTGTHAEDFKTVLANAHRGDYDD